MKKILTILILILILSSCRSKYVCGGRKGGRAVSIEKPQNLQLKNS